MFEEYEYPEDAVPKYTLTIVSRSSVNTEEELTDNLIASSGSELTEAYGLYVADKFVGASYDDEEIESLLETIKDEYRTGDPDEVVEFTNPVTIKEGLYPKTSIVNIAALEEKLKENESEEQTYTVQEGDAPTVIAQEFEMLYADFKALNPDVEKSLLVGQEVLIEKAVPTLGVQVKRTEVYNEEVPFSIEHEQDAWNAGPRGTWRPSRPIWTPWTKKLLSKKILMWNGHGKSSVHSMRFYSTRTFCPNRRFPKEDLMDSVSAEPSHP